MGEKISAIVFKVLIPLVVLAMMALISYPICNKAEGFDYFLFWIIVGFPFKKKS